MRTESDDDVADIGSVQASSMISSLYRWPANTLRASSADELVAHERLRLGDDLAHPRLDALEVLLDERAAVRQLEVVVEAVLDGRADAERGAREQVEHGLGEHVGRGVADREAGPRALSAVTIGDLVAVVERPTQVALARR